MLDAGGSAEDSAVSWIMESADSLNIHSWAELNPAAHQRTAFQLWHTNYLSASDLGITYYTPCNSLLIPVPLAQDPL